MRHKRFCCLLLILLSLSSFSQDGYWQQEVHYNINVELDDINRTLYGQIKITYINHSPNTLTFIWFHLYPNAYKNANTALARQVYALRVANRKTPGFIDSLSFSVNNKKASVQNSNHADIIKLILPEALLPGQKIEIESPFKIQIPPFKSRMGYFDDDFMITHWYPKPAVYDRKGWHPMPYLNIGEFYSEFGSFSVSISVPSEYIVAASGKLLTASEVEAYKIIGSSNHSNPSAKIKYNSNTTERRKKLIFQADSVHDFAWFASRNYIIYYDTVQLSATNVIDIFSFGQQVNARSWYQTTDYLKDAVRKYSGWIGEYPYPVISAVQGRSGEGAGAGMEYPMITLITDPVSTGKELDAIITHEAGHNWFYGIIGTNERDHAWMDEGVNTYFQFRYEAEKYLWNSIWQSFYSKKPVTVPGNDTKIFLNTILSNFNVILNPAAIETPIQELKGINAYLEVVYIKPAIWISIFENSVGEENFFHAFRSFFEEWKFKHPYPEDMKASMEKAIHRELTNIFNLLNKRGRFN